MSKYIDFGQFQKTPVANVTTLPNARYFFYREIEKHFGGFSSDFCLLCNLHIIHFMLLERDLLGLLEKYKTNTTLSFKGLNVQGYLNRTI